MSSASEHPHTTGTGKPLGDRDAGPLSSPRVVPWFVAVAMLLLVGSLCIEKCQTDYAREETASTAIAEMGGFVVLSGGPEAPMDERASGTFQPVRYSARGLWVIPPSSVLLTRDDCVTFGRNEVNRTHGSVACLPVGGATLLVKAMQELPS